MSRIPKYAIVGHPNEGKSSVVATLAEDDSVRISDMPGETIVCRPVPLRLDGEDCIHFVDTPGFQNPRKVEAIFAQAVQQGQNPLAAFFEQSEGDESLAHDRELLRPLAEGVGVIYVADGSRPPGAVDRAEIEILRLSGLPRIAILNLKREAEEWKAAWIALCQRAFNATREFNAHQAPFEARLRFLENLRVIDSANEAALEAVIARMKADRTARIGALVERLCEWVGEALHHQCVLDFHGGTSPEAARERAQRHYWEELDRKEKRVWQELRTTLKHKRLKFDFKDDRLLAEGIGSEQTWQVLGLTRQQLGIAATLMGAGGGVVADSMAAGLTFGVFTALGAAGGAASVWLFGGGLPKVKVAGLRLGSDRLVIGPSDSPQFPFILLDRSLLYLRILLDRTHARRDPVTLDPEDEAIKLGIVARLPDSDRKAIARWARSIRRHKANATQSEEARAVQTIFHDLLVATINNIKKHP